MIILPDSMITLFGSLLTHSKVSAHPAGILRVKARKPETVRTWYVSFSDDLTWEHTDFDIQYAMHDFIRSIATRLSNPGLSPRASTIFTQAMSAGHYRWGRRANL